MQNDQQVIEMVPKTGAGLKHKWLEFCFWKWGAWVRLFGYGLHFKPSKGHEPLFSERCGYTKAFYFGPVRVEILKPVWRKQGGF